MFRAKPIVHVDIYVAADQAQTAATSLAEAEVFLPEADPELAESLPDDPASSYRDAVASARTRLDKLLAHYQLAAPDSLPPPRPIEAGEVRAVDLWLGEQWAEASTSDEALRRLQEEERRIEGLLGALDTFRALNVDLELLRTGGNFLDIHVGTVPSDNLTRLGEAVGLAGYLVVAFLQQAGLSHVVVAGPRGQEQTLQSVLRAAGWRVLEVPREFQDRPERVASSLIEQREQLQREQAELLAAIHRRGRELQPGLLRAAEVVMLAAPFCVMGDALRGRGALTVVSGWVPRSQLSMISYRLRRRVGAPVAIVWRPAHRDEAVPSLIEHPRWLKPFVALVQSFGTPRYGEFDPTWLFAITYVAMFGMMFGDIGHGAVIALAGFVARRRLRGYAPFPIAAGLSSMFFGALYGSIFGFEHWIHPLWMSPMSDPVLMLTVALYWGIGFILLVTGLNIVNLLTVGRWPEALFDGKGLMGIVLYGSLIAGVYLWTQGGESAYWMALAGAALLTVLAYHWSASSRPYAERAITVAIEGFETLIGYLSGTLSFLRVAAFSLNHVALAAAVFALADMMGTFGHWTTVILGNVFIIVLEGAIVGIQTMRLEYYEGFSRFFSGDGRAFKPLRLGARVRGGI
jgi:V/A-type H+-transporting ATPase subunit I